MLLQDLWDFVEHERLPIYMAYPLFQRPRAMRYNVYNLGDKGLVGRDFVVPGLYKFPQYDGQKSVKL